jgi:PAS domain S-box-containing protein
MSGAWTNFLIDPSGLTPHGFCLSWNPWLVWLHAVSDLGIGLTYFTIPFALVLIMRRRPDLVFRPVFGLFAAFILLCGLGHCLDVLTLWVPAYGLEGLVKAATFAVSAVTAGAVWALLPQALTLPSPTQLREVTLDLIEVQQAGLRLELAAREASAAHEALAQELARREAAEARMQDSEARFQILMQSRVSEALYLLDANGNVETWGAGAARMKGYEADEVIGRNFSLFFAAEDIAAGVPARMLGEARDHGRCTAEGYCVAKNGRRSLVLRSLDAIYRNDGSLRGFASVARDVTQQRIEEEQRAIIIDAAPNGMMIVDEAGIITLANTRCAQIFGYEPGALTGKPVESLVPDGFRPGHATLRSRFTDGEDVPGMVTGRVVTGRQHDGGAVKIEVLLSPVVTPRGRIAVASIFDTTERQRLEAERVDAESRARRDAEETSARLDRLSRDLAHALNRAELANQAKSRFLAVVTHELRTPLHGILGYAELMTLEGGLTTTQSAQLNVMMAAGQHLLGMVNSVLDMSQIEADRLDLHPAPTELWGLIGVCLDVVRPAADAKGLKLLYAPGPPAQAVIDATRLQQVLINLLANAIKFTPAGTVEVRLAETPDAAGFRLEVADTGPGVREIHRGRLFQTFERLDPEAVGGIEGTGLGLALADRLVHLMGGRIGYADSPGGGSLFWLELPANRTGGAVPPEAILASPAASRRMRVLVADDEPLNRSIAHEFLRRAGHEAVCVNDGQAAVEAAAAGDFDAILMDVRMPGLNGLDASRQIRALPPPRGEVWIVAVTAQAFAQQIQTCLQAGMDSHVSKPFTQAGLLSALAEALSGRRGTAPPPPHDGPGTDFAGALLLDHGILDGVTAYIPAGEVAVYLGNLAARCDALRRCLGEAPMPDSGDALMEEVHTLAGNAATLGFVAVAGAARALEIAADTRAGETPALTAALVQAINASMPLIRQACARVACVPAP